MYVFLFFKRKWVVSFQVSVFSRIWKSIVKDKTLGKWILFALVCNTWIWKNHWKVLKFWQSSLSFMGLAYLVYWLTPSPKVKGYSLPSAYIPEILSDRINFLCSMCWNFNTLNYFKKRNKVSSFEKQSSV